MARARELIPSIARLTSSCALCGCSSLKWTFARSFAYFAFEIPTVYVVFARRPPNRAIPAFSRRQCTGGTSAYVYSYEKISRKYSRAIRILFVPSLSIPQSFLNPRPTSGRETDAPFSARGVAIHARFNWQNEFLREHCRDLRTP